jgi:pimeloyl-ACP methyl ester carboxylesterase
MAQLNRIERICFVLRRCSPVISTQFRSAVGAVVPWKTISVEGINLAYNDDGTGSVVICLHAIAHGAGDFYHLCQSLRHRYRMIALDFPGHGNSDSDPQPLSLERYTHLLALFIEQLGLKQVTLIGNSLGGSVALQYASQYPQRVQGLILENPGGLDPMDRIKAVFTRLLAGLFYLGLKKSWWYKKGFTDYYRYLVLPGIQSQAQREKIIASAWEIALPLTQAWRSFGEINSDLRAVVPMIACPVLLVWASHDKIVQLQRCLPALSQFPNSELKLLPAGHSPHLETPTEFTELVSTFLTTLDCYVNPSTHC